MQLALVPHRLRHERVDAVGQVLFDMRGRLAVALLNVGADPAAVSCDGSSRVSRRAPLD